MHRSISAMPAGLQQQQLPLCCPCGSRDLYRRGLCEVCYNRRRNRFAGKRERILERDHRTCRVSLAPAPLVVHHRRPSNVSSSLITLFRACHARLHRLRAIDHWVPDLLEELSVVQHSGAPLKLQAPPTR